MAARRDSRTKRKVTAGGGRRWITWRRVVLLLFVVLLVLAFLFRSAIPNWQARRHIAKRELDKAAWWLNVAETIAPGSGQTQFLLARVSRIEGKTAEMKNRLLRAAELGYDRERIVREEWLTQAQQGQMDQVMGRLSELLTDPRGDVREICEAFVLGFIRVRMFPHAHRILEGWAKDFPDDTRPRYFRGLIYRDQSLFKLAEQEFRKALRVDPTHTPSAFELGNVLLIGKSPEEALKYFRVAESSPDHFMESRLGQAHCFRLLGRPKQARALLESLEKEFPESELVAQECSQLDLDEREYQMVIERLGPFVEANPNNVDIRQSYGRALRGAGRIDEAEEHILAAKKITDAFIKANELQEKLTPDPESVGLRHQIARIYMEHGSYQEAMPWLLSAYNLDPTHKETLKSLIEYYEAKGNEASATYFRQQIEAMR